MAMENLSFIVDLPINTSMHKVFPSQPHLITGVQTPFYSYDILITFIKNIPATELMTPDVVLQVLPCFPHHFPLPTSSMKDPSPSHCLDLGGQSMNRLGSPVLAARTNHFKWYVCLCNIYIYIYCVYI